MIYSNFWIKEKVMKHLHCKSYAKLNLCLHVLNRRKDGYHNIQSIFQAIDLHDNITFEKNKDNRINLETNNKILTNENNLIIKACNMLSQKCNLDIGLNISLTKNIPIGSGLGGGSSNAAVTIHAINKLYDIQLSQGDLLSYAERIGSDVPFFINGGTAEVSGRGDIINKISSEQKFYVLIFPDISIVTREIYSLISHRDYSDEQDLENLLGSKLNTFEHTVMEKYPELNQTKYWLSSLGRVRMSGTGSTLYIEFHSYESAIEANREIGDRYRSKMVSSLESYDIFS